MLASSSTQLESRDRSNGNPLRFPQARKCSSEQLTAGDNGKFTFVNHLSGEQGELSLK